MQFIPSTWAAYGMGGDIEDDHDAIMGAANYLRANGAPRRYRNALYAYNHADAYVDAVLDYADQIKADADDFYVYYCWQVFRPDHEGGGAAHRSGPLTAAGTH